jgi:CubicO group peptidase (beta-lactamase class C family)
METDRRIRMNAPAYLRCLAVIVLTVLCAHNANADEVDNLIRAEMKRTGIPGLSVAVVRKGRVVKAQGYGYANVELNVKATKDTVYEIGSITKTFTATAVMMLVQEGKLRLDDKIGAYLPVLPKHWEKITIWHLLTHTSGLRAYHSDENWIAYHRLTHTEAEILQRCAGLPLQFETGTQFGYANTNYFLLGLIIQKISGVSWSIVLSNRIFGPLQMRDTRVAVDDDIVSRRAAGYGRKNDNHQKRDGNYDASSTALVNRPSDSGAVLFAGGELVSSAADMAKWDAALFSGRILDRNNLQRMWSPAKLTEKPEGENVYEWYGTGWGLDSSRGRRFVFHEGRMPGFTSAMYRFVDDDVTVIVLTNLCEQVLRPLVLRIGAYYAPNLLASKLKPKPSSDPGTTEQMKAVLQEISEGKKSTAMTSAEKIVEGYLPLQNRTRLKSQLSEMRSFEFIQSEDVRSRGIVRYGFPVHRVSDYKMTLPSGAFYWTFCLAADGKIADIEFSEEP